MLWPICLAIIIWPLSNSFKSSYIFPASNTGQKAHSLPNIIIPPTNRCRDEEIISVIHCTCHCSQCYAWSVYIVVNHTMGLCTLNIANPGSAKGTISWGHSLRSHFQKFHAEQIDWILDDNSIQLCYCKKPHLCTSPSNLLVLVAFTYSQGLLNSYKLAYSPHIYLFFNSRCTAFYCEDCVSFCNKSVESPNQLDCRG